MDEQDRMRAELQAMRELGDHITDEVGLLWKFAHLL